MEGTNIENVCLQIYYIDLMGRCVVEGKIR